MLKTNTSEGKPILPKSVLIDVVYSQLPTAADREAYDQLKSTPPTAATHPHTFAWFILVGMFDESIRKTWAGVQAPAAKPTKAAPAKKEEPKKEEKPAADDDMDLFGDDDEEDEVSFII